MKSSKFYLISLISILFYLYFFNPALYSQSTSDDCSQPCTEVGDAISRIVYFNFNGCNFMVACGIEHCLDPEKYYVNLEIVSIEGGDNCNDLDMELILQEGLRRALDDLGRNYIPNPTNEYDLEVIIPKCWHLEWDGNNMSYFLPCSTSRCCRRTYTMQYNAIEDLVYLNDQTILTYDNQVCSTIEHSYFDVCEDMCGAHLPDPGETPYPVHDPYDDDCPQNCFWRIMGNSDITGTGANPNFLGTKNNTPLVFKANNIIGMEIVPYIDGQTDKVRVEIGGHYDGTTYINSKLAVNGAILSQELIVSDDDWSEWPDFIFDENYKINSLNEVAEYIKTNKKLPGIPSKDDLLKDGLKIGEFQGLLLQKIEEMTLYILQLNEENTKLKDRLNTIEKLIIKDK